MAEYSPQEEEESSNGSKARILEDEKGAQGVAKPGSTRITALCLQTTTATTITTNSEPAH